MNTSRFHKSADSFTYLARLILFSGVSPQHSVSSVSLFTLVSVITDLEMRKKPS